MNRERQNVITRYYLNEYEIRLLVINGVLSADQVTEAQSQFDSQNLSSLGKFYSYIIEVPIHQQKLLEKRFRGLNLEIHDPKLN